MLVLLLVGCFFQSTSAQTPAITVIYFYGSHRCVSCRAIEAQTRKVLQSDFKESLQTGDIVFRTLNLEAAENDSLVQHYKVYGSSLYLQAAGNQKAVNFTNQGFSWAAHNPGKYAHKLKAALLRLMNESK